ncbi:MAG: recombinase family protein [Candidatus Pacebacteria bacterium]|nr:recombinase family protein [Candidatus Paceibacterota bacterium]MBP9772797.1 recombinase family protein [Candidatus Paceibacterota bacterium]
MESRVIGKIHSGISISETRIKYCLYARKSTESDEKQALSIDSQVKEMTAIAERLKLNVVSVKRESHSAKDSGQRPIFKELIEEVRSGTYDGILTWAPDRLSRNAGDLGSLVDLMDQRKLIHIQTYGQTFSNSPNEKFLLMILCSQAKLENDNKSINVKRGLRARVEMGLWPCKPPTGYTKYKRMDQKCESVIDPVRAPIIKQMFEKVGYDGWSGRKVYQWLKNDINFKTENNIHLSLGNLYRIFQSHFYYGRFEFPKESGNWYNGSHVPIITKELFDLVQEKIKSQILEPRSEQKEFAFTKIMTCGLCGSGITADEKFKHQKNGNVNRYVYYKCTRTRDQDCTCGFVNEDDLISQLQDLMDDLEIQTVPMKEQISNDLKRFKKFEQMLLGSKTPIAVKDIDIRNYAKFILQEGTLDEKREFLRCLKSEIILKNKKVTLKSS